MKKPVFIILFFFAVLISSFTQDLKSFTPLIANNLGDAGRLSATRYAIPCEIIVQTVSGQTLYIAQSANAILAFDMTPEQIRQLTAIKNEGDMPLVLFTRRGTNKDNYRFVVDYLIPLKNVFGVATSNLPKSFTAQDFNEVLDLYYATGNTDPGHRVADKISKETSDALAQQALTQEAERKAAEDAQRQAAENQARQNDRATARERQGLINRSTIQGGYKPCFGTGNQFNDDIPKIAVFGSIYNQYNREFYISSLGNPTIDKDIKLTDSRAVFNEIGHSQGASSQSYLCILFLTQEGNRYTVADYILFGDLINKDPGSTYASDFRNDFIDTWILDNADK
jgi:hypothetical protein